MLTRKLWIEAKQRKQAYIMLGLNKDDGDYTDIIDELRDKERRKNNLFAKKNESYARRDPKPVYKVVSDSGEIRKKRRWL